MWAGKTITSCLKANVRQDAESLGFYFTPANSIKNLTSHFSTLQTMKNWINKIHIPYTESIIQKRGLEPSQRSISFLDAYPIYTVIEF